MASISSLCLPSTLPPFQPISINKTRRMSHTKVLALRREAGHDRNSSGKLVDENMIVLRKRIHEMKMVETNYEPPQEWMDWEKRFYAEYDSIICDAMGHLQSYLMETRPSLTLGMIALISLSVPTSTAVVLYNLLQMTKGFLHLS